MSGSCVVLRAWPLSPVQLLATPRTVARQAPLSMGILQARILEWAGISSSRESFQSRDGTHIVGRFFTVCGRVCSSPETELEGGCCAQGQTAGIAGRGAGIRGG